MKRNSALTDKVFNRIKERAYDEYPWQFQDHAQAVIDRHILVRELIRIKGNTTASLNQERNNS